MTDSQYQELGKDYLEHYGVKGMKWGHHKNRQKFSAIVNSAKGRFNRAASGGAPLGVDENQYTMAWYSLQKTNPELFTPIHIFTKDGQLTVRPVLSGYEVYNPKTKTTKIEKDSGQDYGEATRRRKKIMELASQKAIQNVLRNSAGRLINSLK